ncbi:MAG: riboflavin biosynthesis protein RibF, partial [Pseudomonadota bacterium]
MQVFRDYETLPPQARGTAVAIGNFDGVHRGHRVVIDAAYKVARRHDVPLAVMTFEPHPREIIQPQEAPPRLTSFRAKSRMLRELGVDVVFALRFGPKLMSLPAEAFVTDVLAGRLGVAGIVTGQGFRFGHRRLGDTRVLRQVACGLGIEVQTIPPLELNGSRCSSSRIRELLQAGDVAAAAVLLGRNYSVSGIVRAGDRRGRTIGFPTANVHPFDGRRLMPARGVYAVEAVERDGRTLPAVANLGVRPTFDGRNQLLEVHVLDRTLDL